MQVALSTIAAPLLEEKTTPTWYVLHAHTHRILIATNLPTVTKSF